MISVIIPIRFRADLTRVCIDSVLQYTPDAEVILVLDGVDDEMSAMLSRYNVKTVRNAIAEGYCRAINKGYREISSETEYVILLNSDTVVVPGWSEALIQTFAQFPRAGIIVPRLLEEQGPQSTDAKDEDYREVKDAKGAVMCLPRTVCEELVENNTYTGTVGTGLLDEQFGLGGGDDNDLCHRVRKLGRSIVVCYKAFVYHYNSASFRVLFNNDKPRAHRYAGQQLSRFKEKWRGELNHKPYVMIAIPCLNGFIHHELAGVLCGWSKSPHYRCHIEPVVGRAPLDNARNYAVKRFLESTCDYLMFVDSDIIPPLNCLERLLAADVDIISPVCLIFTADAAGNMLPMPVTLKRNEVAYEVVYGTKVYEVDAISGGCFLVKRRVYEALPRPFAFTYDEDGCVVNSEDIVFSRRAKDHGYSISVDFDVHCKHVKPVDLLDVSRSFAALRGSNGR